MKAEVLDIRITDVGPSLYVALKGELDLYTSSELTPLETQIIESAVTSVNLDLTNLNYIDSTGLMHLVRLYRSMREKSGSLTVHVCEGSLVQRVIKLIGAGDLFPVVTCSAASPSPHPASDPPCS